MVFKFDPHIVTFGRFFLVVLFTVAEAICFKARVISGCFIEVMLSSHTSHSLMWASMSGTYQLVITDNNLGCSTRHCNINWNTNKDFWGIIRVCSTLPEYLQNFRSGIGTEPNWTGISLSICIVKTKCPTSEAIREEITYLPSYMARREPVPIQNHIHHYHTMQTNGAQQLAQGICINLKQ